ncbi:MAG: hypothetical protein C4576_17150 [Desulfobacteraceae bacterium]|nr:MAG: hypothetical protein C4576_17150 [Desulfobacteraceae bacterium]
MDSRSSQIEVEKTCRCLNDQEDVRACSGRRFLRPAFTILVLGTAVLLMVCVRAWYGSAEAYRKGEESLQNNQVMQAISYFDRAIHWYTPFNPHVERSAQKLWALSEASEKKGERTLALAALTSIRSGFVSASGLFSPGRAWIKRCEERIEFLTRPEAYETSEAGGDLGKENQEEQKSRHPPSVFWSIVLEIGLLGWIGWIILAIGCFRKKRHFSPSLLKWGAPLLVFYTIWIIGMMLA